MAGHLSPKAGAVTANGGVRMVTKPRYLLSDIGSQSGHPCGSKTLVTLSPTIPASELGNSSTFHRALHTFNAEHLTQRTWDELTVPEQEEVRALMRELQRRRHVHS